VLVLGVLPLRSYALLEEVVVGLEAQLGGWRDVVLDGEKVTVSICRTVSDLVAECPIRCRFGVGSNIRRCPRIPRRS
jgi:hypothetical protein